MQKEVGEKILAIKRTNLWHPVKFFMITIIFFIYPVFTLYKLTKKTYSGVKLSIVLQQVLQYQILYTCKSHRLLLICRRKNKKSLFWFEIFLCYLLGDIFCPSGRHLSLPPYVSGSVFQSVLWIYIHKYLLEQALVFLYFSDNYLSIHRHLLILNPKILVVPWAWYKHNLHSEQI